MIDSITATSSAYSQFPKVSIKAVSATSSSPAMSEEGMAFLTMMALGKKGDDKVSTMERMALMAMLLQKKEKFEMAEITMLPTGYGSQSFTFSNTSGYTSHATPIAATAAMGMAVDVEA